MDSRTNPMAPDEVGDSSVDSEIAGESEPLKRDEGGDMPPPGALDDAFPATSPTEDPRSDPELDHDPQLGRDPGRVTGSRDPDVAGSVERDNQPGDRDGGTPYDAEGASGSGGE